jgi:hypothetical protein
MNWWFAVIISVISVVQLQAQTAVLHLDSIPGSEMALSNTIRINYHFTDTSGCYSRVGNFYYSTGDTLHWTAVGQVSLMDNTCHSAGSYVFGWNSQDQFFNTSAANVYLKFNLENYQSINTWTSVASMSAVRQSLACGTANDKVYAISGRTSANNNVTRVEEYNPATNTWILKSPVSVARYDLTACGVNGKVYAIGGATTVPSGLIEEYDPGTDTWTTRAPMPTARYCLKAEVVNGKIYVICGIHLTHQHTRCSIIGHGRLSSEPYGV